MRTGRRPCPETTSNHNSAPSLGRDENNAPCDNSGVAYSAPFPHSQKALHTVEERHARAQVKLRAISRGSSLATISERASMSSAHTRKTINSIKHLCSRPRVANDEHSSRPSHWLCGKLGEHALEAPVTIQDIDDYARTEGARPTCHTECLSARSSVVSDRVHQLAEASSSNTANDGKGKGLREQLRYVVQRTRRTSRTEPDASTTYWSVPKPRKCRTMTKERSSIELPDATAECSQPSTNTALDLGTFDNSVTAFQPGIALPLLMQGGKTSMPTIHSLESGDDTSLVGSTNTINIPAQGVAASFLKYEREREAGLHGTPTSYSGSVLGIDLDLEQEFPGPSRRPCSPMWFTHREKSDTRDMHTITSSALPILLSLAAASGIVRRNNVTPFPSFHSPSGKLIRAAEGSSSCVSDASCPQQDLVDLKNSSRKPSIRMPQVPEPHVAMPLQNEAGKHESKHTSAYTQDAPLIDTPCLTGNVGQPRGITRLSSFRYRSHNHLTRRLTRQYGHDSRTDVDVGALIASSLRLCFCQPDDEENEEVGR